MTQQTPQLTEEEIREIARELWAHDVSAASKRIMIRANIDKLLDIGVGAALGGMGLIGAAFAVTIIRYRERTGTSIAGREDVNSWAILFAMLRMVRAGELRELALIEGGKEP